MDLSATEELSVLPVDDHCVRVRWRLGDAWDEFDYVDEDSGYADDEDVLWWLLRQNAPLDLVRSAVAEAYPNLDVDAAINWVTMPDRAERRAVDEDRRRAAKAEFRAEDQGR